MGKVGRPVRYKTAEAQKEASIRKEKQANRLDTLMKSKKISGKALGTVLGVSDKSISKYRNGAVELPLEYAEKLHQTYEYIPEYWIGETDIKTDKEWTKACEDAEAVAIDYELNQKIEEIQNRVKLFDLCGFKYECSGMASFDFLGIAPGTVAPKGNHRLTSHDGKYTADFSDEELEVLEHSIREQLAFACFKKNCP